MKTVRIIMDDRAKADKGAIAYSKALTRRFAEAGIESMISSLSPASLHMEKKPYILIEPTNHAHLNSEYNLDNLTTPKAIIEFIKTINEKARIHVIGNGKTVGSPLLKMLRELGRTNVTMTSSQDHPEDVQDCINKAHIIVSCAPYGVQLPYELNVVDDGCPYLIDAGNNFSKSLWIDNVFYMSPRRVGDLSIHQIINNYKELYNVEDKTLTD